MIRTPFHAITATHYMLMLAAKLLAKTSHENVRIVSYSAYLFVCCASHKELSLWNFL